MKAYSVLIETADFSEEWIAISAYNLRHCRAILRHQYGSGLRIRIIEEQDY